MKRAEDAPTCLAEQAVGRVLAIRQRVAGNALFVLSVRVQAAAPERRELVQALLAWLASVRQTAGFVGAHVSEDLEAPGAYVLSSTWRRRQDMDAHVVGPDFGVLLGAFEVFGRDTHLVVTSAAEGAEDGWSYARRLRGRARPLHEGVGALVPGISAPPPAGASDVEAREEEYVAIPSMPAGVVAAGRRGPDRRGT